MHRLSRRSLTFLLTGTLALPFAAACGGDDDGGNNDADAAPDGADAAPEPDAAPLGPLMRTGTLAITETAIVGTPLAGELNVISFNDESTRTVAPLAGFESPINGCAVVVYDVEAGDTEPDIADGEGDIVVTGTSAGPFGCASSPLADPANSYMCQSATPAEAQGSANTAVLSGAADTLTMPDGVEVTDAMVGSYIVLSGFPLVNAKFPIVGVDDVTDTLQLVGVPADDLGDADSTYAVFIGAAPVPANAPDYVGDDTTEVHITKEAGDVIPAIDETINPAGQGFELVDDVGMGYYLPNAIPTDGADEVSFHCDTCGDDGSAPGGGFTAIIINGRTTDGVLPLKGDPFGTEMPDAETAYATFQCSFLGDEVDTATIPQAAMEAIMGTNPTRVQISVGRVAGYPKSADDFTWSANVLVGHTILGYTTVE